MATIKRSGSIIQICVTKRREYVLGNATLGDLVVVRTCSYTNLDIIVYPTIHVDYMV
jgi:hypothetical protein